MRTNPSTFSLWFGITFILIFRARGVDARPMVTDADIVQAPGPQYDACRHSKEHVSDFLAIPEPKGLDPHCIGESFREIKIRYDPEVQTAFSFFPNHDGVLSSSISQHNANMKLSKRSAPWRHGQGNQWVPIQPYLGPGPRPTIPLTVREDVVCFVYDEALESLSQAQLAFLTIPIRAPVNVVLPADPNAIPLRRQYTRIKSSCENRCFCRQGMLECDEDLVRGNQPAAAFRRTLQKCQSICHCHQEMDDNPPTAGMVPAPAAPVAPSERYKKDGLRDIGLGALLEGGSGGLHGGSGLYPDYYTNAAFAPDTAEPFALFDKNHDEFAPGLNDYSNGVASYGYGYGDKSSGSLWSSSIFSKRDMEALTNQGPRSSSNLRFLAKRMLAERVLPVSEARKARTTNRSGSTQRFRPYSLQELAEERVYSSHQASYRDFCQYTVVDCLAVLDRDGIHQQGRCNRPSISSQFKADRILARFQMTYQLQEHSDLYTERAPAHASTPFKSSDEGPRSSKKSHPDSQKHLYRVHEAALDTSNMFIVMGPLIFSEYPGHKVKLKHRQDIPNISLANRNLDGSIVSHLNRDHPFSEITPQKRRWLSSRDGRPSIARRDLFTALPERVDQPLSTLKDVQETAVKSIKQLKRRKNRLNARGWGRVRNNDANLQCYDHERALMRLSEQDKIWWSTEGDGYINYRVFSIQRSSCFRICTCERVDGKLTLNCNGGLRNSRGQNPAPRRKARDRCNMICYCESTIETDDEDEGVSVELANILMSLGGEKPNPLDVMKIDNILSSNDAGGSNPGTYVHSSGASQHYHKDYSSVDAYTLAPDTAEPFMLFDKDHGDSPGGTYSGSEPSGALWGNSYMPIAGSVSSY